MEHRALAFGDFSGALGSEVTSVRAACLQAGCWTSSSSFPERAPPHPAPQPALGSPRSGLGALLRGLGLAWASLGRRCAALHYCCYRLLGLKASSCPPSSGAGLESCHFAFQCEVQNQCLGF